MRTHVKQLVLANLPESLLFWMKKHRYLRLLRSQGPEDEKEFSVIARLVKPGDHVIDVGANYGVYMRFLSGLVGKEGMVHCVEPIPITFKLLRLNAKRLGLDNVRLLNYAFSDQKDNAVMEIPQSWAGAENYYMAKILTRAPDPKLRHVQIETVTLDSQFASQVQPVTFVKCDVEGHELFCVKGALESIRRWRPAWCVEVSGNPEVQGSDSWKLFHLFEAESYRAFWFDGRVLRNRQPGDSSINYFFLQQHHVRSVSDLCAT